MTVGLVGGHPVTTFTAPALGKDVIQAADAKTNDNALGVILTAHDAEVSTHFQSSTAAARVALTAATAGAGSKWIDTDTRRIYYSNGSAFQEATYLQLTDGGTVAGAVILGSSLAFTTAATRIIPGATSFAIRNNANNADNLGITDAGVLTGRLAFAVGTAGTVSANNYRLTEAGTGMYQASAAQGRLSADGVDAIQWDSDATANFTRAFIFANTGNAFHRIKTGANASGPGGTGRALFIDDA